MYAGMEGGGIVTDPNMDWIDADATPVDERKTEIITEYERVKRIIEDTDWSIYEEPEAEPDPFMYILGLDPGGTTGVAMLRIDTTDDKINPELVYLHQIADGRYGFKDWFLGSKVNPKLIIVSEKWKERNVKGANREPQYIEGSMHMLWDDDNIVYQYPDQKELIPDEWLKENNLWTPDKRHQMDALKHAFAYLRNEEHSATLESLSNMGEPDDGEGNKPEPMAQPGDAERATIGNDDEPAPGDEPGEDEDGTEAGEGQDGAESDGEGDGGTDTPKPGSKPQNGAEALAEAMKAGAKLAEAAKAMQEMAEGAGEAAEAIEGLAKALDGINSEYDDDYEPIGPGSGGGEGWEIDPNNEVETHGTRTRRERNGAFAGFNPEGYDQGVSLLDD